MSHPKGGAGCPMCGKPRDLAFRPFCSKRCADLDLQKWFTGAYAIPLVEETSEEEGKSDLEADD